MQKGLRFPQKQWIMKQIITNNGHSILKVILTGLVLLTGIVLIGVCLDIYFSSEHDPYSPATIAQAFARISAVVWITVIGIAAGIAVDLLSPDEKKRPRAIVHEKIALEKLRNKINTLSETAESRTASFRRQRILLTAVPCVITVALMIYPCLYFSDAGHFSVTNLNADIVKAILIVMFPAILTLIVFFAAGVLIRRSLRNEIIFYKELLKEVPQKVTTAPQSNGTNDKKWFLWSIRGGFLLLAILFITMGVCNGGVQDVLKKAIAICTECIGLG
jgi:hypothetical protein